MNTIEARQLRKGDFILEGKGRHQVSGIVMHECGPHMVHVAIHNGGTWCYDEQAPVKVQ